MTPTADDRITPGEHRLTPVELDVCWELLDLGDTPLTLALPSPGRTFTERGRIVAGVLDGLRERGLADAGGPVPELADRLRLLARPDLQLDLYLAGELSPPDTAPPRQDTAPATTGDHAPRETVGIGVLDAHRGCVLLRRADRIRLLPVRPSGVLPALLGAMPTPRPATGRQVNIDAGVYDAARRATSDGSLWTMADELVARGVPRPDATSWARMCTGVRGVGQFGTAVRRDGVSRFGPWVIGFHRGGTGDVLQLRRPEHAGRTRTVTVGPLDRPRLARLVEQLSGETRK
jgi:hypothetical protein